jgi:cell wall-associated NlpC family hydrolase
MSYADVVSQMQTIQTRLAQLGMLPTGGSRAASASNAASFATALDGASATSGVTASTTASTDGTLISGNGTTGDDVVQAALAYKGVPYVLGGESKSGIDCSGLVQAAFGNLGVSVPRLVHEQQTVGQKVDSLKDAKPGDLIVLNGGDHIAIWMGNDTVIHAPYPGRTVSVQKAWFDDGDVTAIRRIVPASDAAAAGSATPVAAASTPATGTAALAAAQPVASPLAGSGLSAATVTKATSMLSTYGADVGLYDATGGSGSTSLASLLASFGLSGTSPTSSSSSSRSAQQIVAARTALLGVSA